MCCNIVPGIIVPVALVAAEAIKEASGRIATELGITPVWDAEQVAEDGREAGRPLQACFHSYRLRHWSGVRA